MNASLRCQRALFPVALASLGVALGGPRSAQEPAPLPGAPAHEADAAVREALERLDPARDGWDSEVFSERLAARLESLGKVLAQGADAEALAELVDPDLRCGPLSLVDPVIVRAGGGLVVRATAPARPESASETERRGAEGLAEALAEWAGDLASAPAFHVSFKVVRVGLEGDALEARVLVQADARPATGAVQRNARWSTVWSIPAEGEEPRLVDLRSEALEEVLRPGTSRPLFADATGAVLGGTRAFREQLLPGLDSWRRRLDPALVVPLLAHPAGIAVGDVDGDGLEDLYLCQPGGLPNRLFLHRRDGRVRDVSAGSGLDVLDFTRSALFVDLDGDRDLDAVLVVRSDLVFFENDGQAHFVPRVTLAVPEATSLAAADFDGDDDLDVYACAYFGPYQGGAFPLPYHDANNGQRNALLRNDGDWGFRDVTEEVGLDVNNRRFSFAAAWEDHDDDGDQDLYVANDFGRNNLYRNDGGRFVDVAAAAGVEDVSAGMGVAWGDFDNDGRPDLYSSNMFSSAGQRVTYQRRFQDGAADHVRAELRRHSRGNTLFRNLGDGTFADVAEEAGVTLGRWAWGSVFLDLDQDGWLDLFVPNGFLTQELPDDL